MRTSMLINVAFMAIASTQDVSAEHDIGFLMPAASIVSPAVCTCPNGYELVDNSCQRVLESLPHKTCPPAAKLENGMCIRRAKPESQCKYEYLELNNECIKRESALPEMKCPYGYVLDRITVKEKKMAGITEESAIVCSKKKEVDLMRVCPDGSRFTGSCKIEKSVPATYECKPGYSHHNGLCTRTEKVSCEMGHKRALEEDTALAEVESTASRTLRTIPHVISLPAKHGSTNPDFQASTAHHVESGAFKPEIVNIDNECKTTVTVQPTPTCNVGRVHGNHCKIVERVEPVLRCTAFGNEADCYTYERISPNASCPAGFKQHCSAFKGKGSLKCECIQTLILPLEIYCPIGFALVGPDCISKTEPFETCSANEIPVDDYCHRFESIAARCYYTVRQDVVTGDSDVYSSHHHEKPGIKHMD